MWWTGGRLTKRYYELQTQRLLFGRTKWCDNKPVLEIDNYSGHTYSHLNEKLVNWLTFICLNYGCCNVEHISQLKLFGPKQRLARGNTNNGRPIKPNEFNDFESNDLFRRKKREERESLRAWKKIGICSSYFHSWIKWGILFSLGLFLPV